MTVPHAAYEGLKIRVENLKKFHNQLVVLHETKKPAQIIEDLTLCTRAYSIEAYKCSEIAQLHPDEQHMTSKCRLISPVPISNCKTVLDVAHMGRNNIGQSTFNPSTFLLGQTSVKGAKELGNDITKWKTELYHCKTQGQCAVCNYAQAKTSGTR